MQRESDVVGAEVRAHRARLGLTREHLAERCAELGADITASVLVNIETGRRDKDGRRRRDITIDEVLILARALDVRPEQLFAPGDVVGSAPMDVNTAFAQWLDMHPVTVADVMEDAIKKATKEWLDRNGPDLFGNPNKEN